MGASLLYNIGFCQQTREYLSLEATYWSWKKLNAATPVETFGLEGKGVAQCPRPQINMSDLAMHESSLQATSQLEFYSVGNVLDGRGRPLILVSSKALFPTREPKGSAWPHAFASGMRPLRLRTLSRRHFRLKIF